MRTSTIAVVLVSTALLSAVACSDVPPTWPSHVQNQVHVTSLTITGKTSSNGVHEWGEWRGMVPGETAQLRAIATFSDGTERDVTAEITWTCPDMVGVVQFVAPGAVRALASGWEGCLARYGSTQSSSSRAEFSFRVAPAGLFLLSVGVDDGQWAAMGALVQVTSAAGTFSASTPVWGLVSLPAIGETVVRVEKAGWATVTARVTVVEDDAVLCRLVPPGSEPAVTGRPARRAR
jgi:hypothetical protein